MKAQYRCFNLADCHQRATHIRSSWVRVSVLARGMCIANDLGHGWNSCTVVTRFLIQVEYWHHVTSHWGKSNQMKSTTWKHRSDERERLWSQLCSRTIHYHVASLLSFVLIPGLLTISVSYNTFLGNERAWKLMVRSACGLVRTNQDDAQLRECQISKDDISFCSWQNS